MKDPNRNFYLILISLYFDFIAALQSSRLVLTKVSAQRSSLQSTLESHHSSLRLHTTCDRWVSTLLQNNLCRFSHWAIQKERVRGSATQLTRVQLRLAFTPSDGIYRLKTTQVFVEPTVPSKGGYRRYDRPQQSTSSQTPHTKSVS